MARRIRRQLDITLRIDPSETEHPVLRHCVECFSTSAENRKKTLVSRAGQYD